MRADPLSVRCPFVRCKMPPGETCGGFGAVPEEPVSDRAAAPQPETYDEVWRDRERLRERLDQFEAYGFPNVAAALDRIDAAESRAERLAEALREIDARTGHFGEAPPPPEWMPMLSLIAWVGRTARAALAEHRDAKAAAPEGEKEGERG